MSDVPVPPATPGDDVPVVDNGDRVTPPLTPPLADDYDAAAVRESEARRMAGVTAADAVDAAERERSAQLADDVEAAQERGRDQARRDEVRAEIARRRASLDEMEADLNRLDGIDAEDEVGVQPGTGKWVLTRAEGLGVKYLKDDTAGVLAFTLDPDEAIVYTSEEAAYGAAELLPGGVATFDVAELPEPEPPNSVVRVA